MKDEFKGDGKGIPSMPENFHQQAENAPQDPQQMQQFMEMFCRAMMNVSKEQRMGRGSAAAAPRARTQENTIDLIALFFRVLENFKYIALVAVIFGVIGGFYANRFMTPVYSATAKLYVIGEKETNINISDIQLGNQLAPDYQEVFRTWEVHEMVRQELGLNYSYSALQSMLTVTNPEDTRVLYITVRNADAKMATDLANAYAQAAKRFILETMDTQEPNDFSVALVPGNAATRSRSTYVMAGFLLGTVLTVGIIVLAFVLDDRPRSPEDVAKYAGIPTLAVIPEVEKTRHIRKRIREAKDGEGRERL